MILSSAKHHFQHQYSLSKKEEWEELGQRNLFSSPKDFEKKLYETASQCFNPSVPTILTAQDILDILNKEVPKFYQEIVNLGNITV